MSESESESGAVPVVNPDDCEWLEDYGVEITEVDEDEIDDVEEVDVSELDYGGEDDGDGDDESLITLDEMAWAINNLVEDAPMWETGDGPLIIDYEKLASEYPDHADAFVDNVGGVINWLRPDSIDSGHMPEEEVVKVENPTEDLRWTIGSSPRGKIGSLVSVRAALTNRSERTTVRHSVSWRCGVCAFVTASSTRDDWSHQEPDKCECGADWWEPSGGIGSDYRAVVLETLPEDTPGDSNPESILGEMVGEEIVDDSHVSAGERVEVTGILRQEPVREGDQEVDTYIEILSVEPLDRDTVLGGIDDDEWDLIRDVLNDPDVSILEEVAEVTHPTVAEENEDAMKAGVLSVVGAPDTTHGGDRIRGDIHQMYVGDPGSGKSHLTNQLEKITPQYIRGDGGGTTSVGLTASAVQEAVGLGGGESWTLKPGLLPRAHGGTLFFEEFDNLSTENQEDINEALEEGVVEVSKAGVSAKFAAETTMIATANPRHGSWMNDDIPANQLQFPQPILSRMDVIWPFHAASGRDEAEEQARRMLGAYKSRDEVVDSDLDTDLIRRYIAYLRESVHPDFNPDGDAAAKLVKWNGQIAELSSSGMPVDDRTFHALIRLARAHARLRMGDEVMERDADVAIHLMMSSFDQLGLWDGDGDGIDTMALRDAVPSPTSASVSQEKRRNAIIAAVMELVNDDESSTRDDVYDALEIDISRRVFCEDLDNLTNTMTLSVDPDGNLDVI